MTELDTMYKKELSRLHNRVRIYSEQLAEARERLALIDRCDWVKAQLAELGDGRPLVKVLVDRTLKKEIEAILDCEFYSARKRFKDLLEARNQICHPHTQDLYWLKSRSIYMGYDEYARPVN